MNDPFKRFVVVSLVFHVSVLVVFSIKSLVFPQKQISVREAIRVDIVGLPDKIIPKEEPAKAHPSPPSAPVKSAEPAPPTSIKKTNQDQKQALARLKSLNAIEKLEREMKEQTTPKVTPSKQEFKGNIVKAGDSLAGMDLLDHNAYLGQLKRRVQKFFVLPQWLAESALKAQALVKIDDRGYVIHRELSLSSGDSTFDQKVLDAIDNASPFPAPPPRLVNVVGVQGLIFNFPD